MLGMSVYVHFPWCLRKCPYCDFATAPRDREALEHEAYADAVVRELDMRAPALEGQTLRSIFFGGGTPSLWQAEQLGRVVHAIRSAFREHASDLEITVECNPSSLDRDHARALRDVGVDRLSIGVQSLDDAELSFLGRLHDGRGALAAIDAALSTHERVSADLMFGLPGQTAETFYSHVDTLLARGLAHVSAYALTIEPATRFGELSRKGLLQQAPDEAYAVMFEGNRRRFGERELSHYEVSNFARAGEESRHNQHYWRGGAYLGLGAAAVGCLHEGQGARRYRNHPDATRYMQRVAGPEVEVFTETLDAQAVIREALMLGLRTREGVDLAALATRTGLDPLVGRERAMTRRLERGDIELDEQAQVLRVPLSRWLMLDGIVADLF
jgi:oxygen-independent coproporphyrinogen-3 oxidase